MGAAVRLIVSFFIGVIVGIIVYIASTNIVFLSKYAELLALVAFVAGWYVSWQNLPGIRQG